MIWALVGGRVTLVPMTTTGAMRPNLLFMMTDHQRADSLGMVQAGEVVTPRLNALAAESMNFTRAYSTCPLCVPARTALATGLYPTRTNVLFNQTDPVSHVITLPEQLAALGYDLAHVGIDHVRVRPGMRQRVAWSRFYSNEQYSERVSDRYEAADPTKFRRQVNERHGQSVKRPAYSNAERDVWPGDAAEFMDCVWGREAQAFVQEPARHGGRPFALFVYLWAPHPPLRVPEPYASLFDPAGITLPSNINKPARGEPANRRASVPAQLAEGRSEQQWRETWAAHLGLVRLADDVVGGILDALQAGGHSDNTVVIFCSDHGDHLGQHGMYQKMEMYEQAVRVPCLIRTSGTPGRSRSGGVCDSPISHLDITATVQALTGCAQRSPDGRSLVPVLEGGELADEPVFSQYSGNPQMGDVRRAIITRRWKYVYDPHAHAELYDLERDPLEMRNLARHAAQASRVAQLHAALRDWHVARDDRVDFGASH